MSETQDLAAARTRARRNRAGPAMKTEPLYENWPDDEKSLRASVDAHTATLAETNRHLATLAGCASETLTFIKRAIPWSIAAVGVLWPAIGKIISSLPPL